MLDADLYVSSSSDGISSRLRTSLRCRSSQPSQDQISIADSPYTMSDDNIEGSIDSFIRDVVKNNPSVSDKGLAEMLKDTQLQHDVDSVMQIHRCLLVDKSNPKLHFDPSIGFTVPPQADSNHAIEVHIPTDPLLEFYHKERLVKSSAPVWVCKCCKRYSLDENTMQYHVTRCHFVQSMGTDSPSMASVEIDMEALSVIPNEKNDSDSTTDDEDTDSSEDDEGSTSSSVVIVEQDLDEGDEDMAARRSPSVCSGTSSKPSECSVDV